MKALAGLRRAARRVADAVEAFDREDPEEPFYDPVHLGAALVLLLVTIGVLYWLLWTMLVYEGGLWLKVRAGLDVLLTGRTLRDYGYTGGPYGLGAFEGWAGNAAAAFLSLLAVVALHRLYWDAAKRKGRR